MKTKNLYISIAAICIAILGLASPSQAQTTTFNNEKMRVGNGVETSINPLGNMQQPFYKSGLSWFKLTYSDYALNASFATGGDGTNEWNLNGTLLHDPVLSSHVVNTAGFTYASGTSGTGTGVVISTGSIVVGGVALGVEHTYELLPDNSFIKVKVKITNESSTYADNVRMWVGTRDDWVGNTDGPTKQRGNLVDGAFQQIPNTATKASVVRVTSASEGVLFYTDTDKANSIIQSCCSWVNVYNQNPATASAQATGDGSYGFYVRFNALSAGQSDEFTWFYAAGSISDLDDITNQVAQASGAISDITCSTATYEAQSSAAGTGYFMLVPAGSTAPSAAEIKAGVDYGSATVVDAGSAAMGSGVPQPFGIVNIVHSTAYSLHFVLEDAVPQFSNITTVNFTAGSAPTVSLATQPTTTCGSPGNGSAVASVSGGTAPYTYSWSSGESIAEISDKVAGNYTLQVSDNGGCPVVESIASIGSDDQIAPVAIARDLTIYFDQDGQATITTEMVNNGSTDDCAITEMELSNTEFNCDLPIFTDGYSVTLFVRDAAGNESSAIALVSAIDTIKPIAIAQNITLALDADGNAMATADMADNGSADNCSIASRGLSQTAFDCSDLGTQQAVLTVEDPSGNGRQVALNITVEDHIAPSLEVQNFNLILNAENSATLQVSDIETSAGDNCGIANKSLNISDFDCSHVGENMVELTVTDASGNATTQTAVVTITDATAPVAMGHDITLELDENGEVSIATEEVEDLFDNGSSDNCALKTDGFGISTTNFDCSQLGEQVYTYTVTDMDGNTASTEVLIDLIDPISPVAIAEDLSIMLDINGEASLSASLADAGSTDNCSIASRSLSKSSFNCTDIGTQEIVLTVSDTYGNTSQASFTLTVNDMIAPTAAFAANATVYLNAAGTATPSTEGLIEELSDNCAIASTQFNVEAFDCSDIGLQNISFIAEDSHGNLTQIDGQIMVVDTVKPTFTLESIVLELNSEGTAELTEAMLIPYALDACGIAEVAIQQTIWTCSEADYSTQIVVFDMHGNVTQRSLDITLLDNTAPSISAQDMTLSLAADGRVAIHPEMFNFVATDNCAVVEVTLNKNRFTCADLGRANVIITATDAAGNTASHTIVVAVIDDLAPVLLVPDFIKVCEGPVDYNDHVSATDNCDVYLTQITGPAPGTKLSAGQYAVAFMAQDDAGNTTIKAATLEVSAHPEVDLGGDINKVLGSVFELSVENDPSTKLRFLWTTGETSPSIMVTFMEEMTVGVTVTNSVGCSGYDELNITEMIGLSSATSEDGNSFNLFPNPASNEVKLTFGINEVLHKSTLSITDLQGKVVTSKQLAPIENGQTLDVDVANLAKGLYLLTISSAQTKMTARFAKQ
jgi:hypothetical protein